MVDIYVILGVDIVFGFDGMVNFGVFGNWFIFIVDILFM